MQSSVDPEQTRGVEKNLHSNILLLVYDNSYACDLVLLLFYFAWSSLQEEYLS